MAAVTTFVVATLVGLACWRWNADQPRRACLQAAANLHVALQSGDNAKLLEFVVLPASLQERTTAEQSEFLRKALADEISADGLTVLRRDGQFGPLTNIFPAEAAAWTQQAGVNVGDCVAFKLERNGVRAEVVLAGDGRLDNAKTLFRIVRCNNVKQLASAQ